MDSKSETTAIIVIAVLGCFFAVCIIICTLCIYMARNNNENEVGMGVELA